MTLPIPYSSGIPNPNNDPADDVATMQTNAGSISTIIAVDHVGFGVSGGGQHEQVTFNSNNPPTPPVSPPVLFTNNQDGAGNSLPGSLAELFFYSGSAAQSKNQYNVTGTNGSVMLPMGIILKWGSTTFMNTQNPTVTFTNAFPNAIFGVFPSLLNAGYSSSSTAPTNVILSQNTAGFTARVAQSGSATWFWVAIGN